mmetsp:Transcript_10090/g.15956  ORF Transcript_10090/g.15956 Transcript_10090/m.15956 type:complete len:84 (+) Transcript_10090:908-1159(+)
MWSSTEECSYLRKSSCLDAYYRHGEDFPVTSCTWLSYASCTADMHEAWHTGLAAGALLEKDSTASTKHLQLAGSAKVRADIHV